MGKLREGYKQTKVGVIPEEWDTHRIDRVLRRIRKKVEVEKEVMYQQIGIRSHAKGIFHKELVSGEALGNKSVFWIEEDAFIVNIVFAWEQAVAKTTEAEKGMIASHRFPMYKAKDNKVDIDYILYFFKSKRGKHLLGLASPGGAGRNKTLGQKEFSELKLPLPPLKEQQKIAQILSTWDSAIAKQEALIEAKEQLKKGLMQKLLSGEVRFEGFDGEWEEVRLGSLTKFYLGLTYTPTYVKKGIPFLSVKDIKGSLLSFKNTKYISAEEFENSTSNAKPRKGDILFGRVGTLGNPIIVETNIPFCIFVSLGFMRVNNDISNILIKHWMNSIFFKKQVESQVAGSSQQNLNVGWLKKFKLKLPPKEEQKKIAEALSTADKEIGLLKNELETLEEQKRGLMQRLLSGDVRVVV